MKRCAAVLFLILGMLLSFSEVVRADGKMFPDEATWKKMREKALINEPEQKAVIFFDKGMEDLIISASFEGPAGNFAWVVPVPARPKVDILKGALFHELKAIVEPRRPKMRSGATGGGAMSGGVELLERKTVGAYDVSVLKATDGQALFKWLRSNRYYVSPESVGPIKAYVKDKWTFVACRVKSPASAKGLQTGTLAPLRLTFPTKRPVYPLRLSSANPKDFSVLIYLLVPERSVFKPAQAVYMNSPTIPLVLQGRWVVKPTARNYLVGKLKYPTLAKLSREKLRIFTGNFYLSPDQCTEDCTWVIPAAE